MYTSVQRGKLSFKTAGKKKKKKKRKNADKDSERTDKKLKSSDSKSRSKEEKFEGLTESEKNYLKTKSKMEERLIKKKIKKTHREKIKEFNNYLGSLTEHNDIPRVGPG
ncbi:hypothetical protein AAMO2058_000801500 [Amorphochlora amoebiformis]